MLLFTYEYSGFQKKKGAKRNEKQKHNTLSMQQLVRNSIRAIPARSFSSRISGIASLSAVSFKVNFTKVSGALKQYDIKTEEGTSLLEALKCAGVPIQCRRRLLS